MTLLHALLRGRHGRHLSVPVAPLCGLLAVAIALLPSVAALLPGPPPAHAAAGTARSVLPATRTGHAARPAYVLLLRSPQVPGATTRFVWSLRPVSSRGAGSAVSVTLAGCWRARQVVKVSSAARSVRTGIDRRSGAIVVGPIPGRSLPATLTVTFDARFNSLPGSAHATVRTAGGTASLAVAGPVCHVIPSLASPSVPEATRTFVWAMRGLQLSRGPQLAAVTLSGCWTARQVARATTSSRGLRVHLDPRRGAITVDHLPGRLQPFTVTVTFRSVWRSAPAGARLIATVRRRATGPATFPVGGPTCRTPLPSATPTRVPRPRATATSTSSPTATSSPTQTPTLTPTTTPSPTATATATATPSSTATATDTPSPTATDSPTPSPTPTSCVEPGAGTYLHTCGPTIVDANGAPMRLRAANWYGFDSNDFVAAGLHDWSYKTIVDRIKSLGFNALRIPFSDELVERDPVVSSLTSVCNKGSCVPVPGTASTPINGAYLLAAISDTVTNGDLAGLDALHVLKTIVDYAGSQGLYVILDNHRSEAAWGPEENGMWYTATSCAGAAPYTCYDPQSWFADWQTVGALFASDPAVIGMDLRNEPHWYNPSPSGGGTSWKAANCAQYVQYAHWGPCNGLNNAATDWAQAATGAGNALLSINPHWLMFVEGGSTYPQDPAGTRFTQDGWGENLQGVASDPIVLQIPNHVVYAPHDYRWYQTNDTVADMYSSWDRNFGFVTVPGHPYTAPLWVGEDGTCTQRNTCIMSTPPGSASYDEAGWWFNTFRFYLEDACMRDPSTGNSICPAGGSMGSSLSWSWWPANGIYVDSWDEKASTWKTCYGQRESYGILGGDMATISNSLLLQSLFQGPSADPAATLSAAPAPSGPWPSYPCGPYQG